MLYVGIMNKTIKYIEVYLLFLPVLGMTKFKALLFIIQTNFLAVLARIWSAVNVIFY